jgi:DNA-binding NarL/FixJ family response regulator
MTNNNVVIASTAGFIADTLRDILRENDYRVYVAGNDKDLNEKINMTFPRFIFIEHCYHGYGTDDFIHKLTMINSNLHIIIWTTTDLKPITAARFIAAGAESFISLRETGSNIDIILHKLLMGIHYCPDDVKDVLGSDNASPIIGKKLTKREIDLIKLIARGCKYKIISKILGISVNTINFHKKNIHRKFGTENAAEILNYCIKHGIINKEDLESE